MRRELCVCEELGEELTAADLTKLSRPETSLLKQIRHIPAGGAVIRELWSVVPWRRKRFFKDMIEPSSNGQTNWQFYFAIEELAKC